LRVGVDDKHFRALGGNGGKIHHRGGFPGAAFLVDDSYDPHECFLNFGFYGTRTDGGLGPHPSFTTREDGSARSKAENIYIQVAGKRYAKITSPTPLQPEETP
jgi:hypothetical protein